MSSLSASSLVVIVSNSAEVGMGVSALSDPLYTTNLPSEDGMILAAY
jgi:hypothetical protein